MGRHRALWPLAGVLTVLMLLSGCTLGRHSKEQGQVVGTTGGSISFDNGWVQLEVVPGGLKQPTAFQLAYHDDHAQAPVVLHGQPVGRPVEVTTDDSQLAKPVRVKMQYDPERLPAGVKPGQVKLTAYERRLGMWLPVASTDDAASRTVTADRPHFSDVMPVIYTEIPTSVKQADAKAATTIKQKLGSRKLPDLRCGTPLPDWRLDVVEPQQLSLTTCVGRLDNGKIEFQIGNTTGVPVVWRVPDGFKEMENPAYGQEDWLEMAWHYVNNLAKNSIIRPHSIVHYEIDENIVQRGGYFPVRFDIATATEDVGFLALQLAIGIDLQHNAGDDLLQYVAFVNDAWACFNRATTRLLEGVSAKSATSPSWWINHTWGVVSDCKVVLADAFVNLVEPAIKDTMKQAVLGRLGAVLQAWDKRESIKEFANALVAMFPTGQPLTNWYDLSRGQTRMSSPDLTLAEGTASDGSPVPAAVMAVAVKIHDAAQTGDYDKLQSAMDAVFVYDNHSDSPANTLAEWKRVTSTPFSTP